MTDTSKPACAACSSPGFVDDPAGETGTANCPDCNPAPEHVGTGTAEYRQWVEALQAGAVAERRRIKHLLSRPFLNALRCIPDGEIRDGCHLYDGKTVREQARQVYLAIDDTDPRQFGKDTP